MCHVVHLCVFMSKIPFVILHASDGTGLDYPAPVRLCNKFCGEHCHVHIRSTFSFDKSLDTMCMASCQEDFDKRAQSITAKSKLKTEVRFKAEVVSPAEWERSAATFKFGNKFFLSSFLMGHNFLFCLPGLLRKRFVHHISVFTSFLVYAKRLGYRFAYRSNRLVSLQEIGYFQQFASF